jgi:hypothetical protein
LSALCHFLLAVFFEGCMTIALTVNEIFEDYLLHCNDLSPLPGIGTLFYRKVQHTLRGMPANADTPRPRASRIAELSGVDKARRPPAPG